jgi:phage gp36-like protein
MGINGFVHGFFAGATEGALSEPEAILIGYATTKQLEEECGGRAEYLQLFDRDQDNVADIEIVRSCLIAAAADIDSYAAKKFAVPMVPTPVISQKAAEIARLKAERRYRVYTDEHGLRWDAIYGSDHFKPGWLLQLAKGMVTPGSDPMPRRHGTMAVDQAFTDMPRERDSSREKLKGFW